MKLSKLESLRWDIASVLSRWAIRLRGQKVYGTVFQLAGNEANALHDRIWCNVVSLSVVTHNNGEIVNEIEGDLRRLAQIASATWFHPKTIAEADKYPELEPNWLKDFDSTPKPRGELKTELKTEKI